MLEIKNMNVTYPGGVKALRDVNLILEEGRIYGIVGPSGGGKSSLIKGILGLSPTTGKIAFRGEKLKHFAKQMAYIEQEEAIDRNFPLTVYQCVLMGAYPALKWFHRTGLTERKKVLTALKQVSLEDYKNRQIGELSGGQFQRVLIARALVQDPVLLFMDEPFEGIDVHNEEEIVKILKAMAADGKTILISHHGLEKVFDYFDEIIMINKKVIAHGKTKETFTDKNFRETFDIIQSAFFKSQD